jgi:hypothetical protein
MGDAIVAGVAAEPQAHKTKARDRNSVVILIIILQIEKLITAD